MSAQILKMRSGKQRSPRCKTAAELIGRQPRSMHTWHGLSGRAYVHAVFSLIGCPPLPEANVILARRTADGEIDVLHIDRVDDAAPTLNLAYVRRLGATLGATEVHVHYLARSYADRARTELDIRSALALDAPGTQPVPALG